MNPNEEHEKHRWENEGGPAVLDPAVDPDEEDQGNLDDFDEDEEEWEQEDDDEWDDWNEDIEDDPDDWG